MQRNFSSAQEGLSWFQWTECETGTFNSRQIYLNTNTHKEYCTNHLTNLGMRVRTAWDFGSRFSALSRKQRTISQIPNDSRSRFHSLLFVVLLKCVSACTRVRNLHVCTCVHELFMRVRNWKQTYSREWHRKISVHLIPCSSGGCFSSRILRNLPVPLQHNIHTDTHTHREKAMDLLGETAFTQRQVMDAGKTWGRQKALPVETRT